MAGASATVRWRLRQVRLAIASLHPPTQEVT